MNKIFLFGRLGKAPELASTQSGVSRCKFSLATSETYTDKQGQRQKKTQWHSIVCWGRVADLCATVLDKGDQVLVEGQLEYRKWDGKDGQTITQAEINATSVQWFSGKKENASASNYQARQEAIDKQIDDLPF